MSFNTPNSPALSARATPHGRSPLGSSSISKMMNRYVEIVAEAVIFELEGTLVNSKSATEAAWVAWSEEVGQVGDMKAATIAEGLKSLKPLLKEEEMKREIEVFEKTILSIADSRPLTKAEFNSVIPSLSLGASLTTNAMETLDDSFFFSDISSSSTYTSRRSSAVTFCTLAGSTPASPIPWRLIDGCVTGSNSPLIAASEVSSDMGDFQKQMDEAWELESKGVDRSLLVHKGGRRLVDLLPEGKWAVVGGGGRTFTLGCLSRVGLPRPNVCITTDTPNQNTSPLLLASEDLGIHLRRTIVFESSPAGIKNAVASGATVIAVCNGQPREEIEGLGADWVVDTLEQVEGWENEKGRLVFRISV